MEQLAFDLHPTTGRVLEFIPRSVKPRIPMESASVADHTARPIKDDEVLYSICSTLMDSGKRYALRNYTIFLFALNTGLRMGDVLTLRISDVYENNRMKTEARIREEKTDKKKTLYFSKELMSALASYIETLTDKEPNAPLFPSRKTAAHTHNRDKDNTGCLNVKSYWGILHEVAEDLGVEHLSCHSARKTYAWTIYQAYKGQLINGEFSALDFLQKELNHSSTAITLRYIGIEQDAMEEVGRGMSIGFTKK